MKPSNELERQAEAAYDYRGHVTLRLKSGETLEAFVFNREFSNPLLKEDRFVEVFPKGSESRRRIRLDDLASIELTGEDCAKPFDPSQQKPR